MIPKRRIYNNMISSSAAPFDPTQIAGLTMWFDASNATSIVSLAGAVSQWNDLSGNTNNIANATTIQQPLTGIGTINSKNIIRFDGIDDNLAKASGIGSLATFTMFCVFANQKAFLTGSDVQAVLSSCVAGNGTPGYALEAVPFASTSQRQFRGDGDGTGIQFYKNGVAGTAGIDPGTACNYNLNEPVIALCTTASCTNESRISVGQVYPGGSTFPGQNDIGEIIFYNSVLSSTNLNKVGNYLAAKWGISWTTIP